MNKIFIYSCNIHLTDAACCCWRRTSCDLCVYVFGTRVSLAKTDEPIKMPFGGKLAQDGVGTYWCHLANTTERPVCDGSVALPLVNSVPFT